MAPIIVNQIIIQTMAGEKTGQTESGAAKRSKQGKGWHDGSTKQRKAGHPANVDMTSPVMQAFKRYQTELDQKHDKYERIVKLNRDVTIESKRTIFLLHRITGDTNKEEILQEAHDKLASVQDRLLSRIAAEIVREDIFCYLRAFTAGLQEYIEAVAFYVYLKSGYLITKKELCDQFLIFKNLEQNKEAGAGDLEEGKSSEPADDTADQKIDLTGNGEESSLQLGIPPTEYILGLADFTGELMRLCVNSIGNGNFDLPFELVDFLRQVFDGFQLIGNQSGRDMPRKLRVMRQSLRKVENVCYTLQVRGSEIPQQMLLDVIESNERDDGGYTPHTD